MPPRPVAVKKVWVNSILLFLFFALVGHKSIDFWERYTLQKDIASMKQNMNVMKDTVRHIERAYDTLQLDITTLIKTVDRKPQKKAVSHTTQPEIYRRKDKLSANIDKKTYNDRQPKAILYESKGTDPFVVEKVTETEKYHRENKKTRSIGKDAVTITRNALKSSGVNTDMSDYDIGKDTSAMTCALY